jgi:hypothetical protein
VKEMEGDRLLNSQNSLQSSLRSHGRPGQGLESDKYDQLANTLFEIIYIVLAK